MLSSNFSPFFKKKLSISHLKIVIWIWWKEIQIILSMMYFKKKKQIFLFIIIISNRKIIRNLMQQFFFHFSMVFWVLAYIYLPSLPMHLLLLCINLGLTKKKYTNTTYNTYLYLETVYSIDKQQTKI